MSRVFFIVNPYSNNNRTKKTWKNILLPEIQKIFTDVRWGFTEKKTDVQQFVQDAIENRFDTIVAVGGDGTINGIVNALIAKADSQCPTLAFLPAGTGCDFIKTLNIPRHIPSALRTIKENKTILSDVGMIEYTSLEKQKPVKKIHYFINIGGCGANGEGIKHFNNSSKIFGGKASFWLAALKTVLQNKHYRVQISYDDEPATVSDLSVLFLCNGQFCGGGMHIAPNASLQNGLFHAVQINAMGLGKGLFAMNRLYSGNYSGLEKYISHRTAKKITVSAINDTQVLVECDGEQPCHIAPFMPTTFAIVPKKLSICIG